MRAFDAVSSNRIPLFVKDDYPALKEFIEAYYEYLTINQIDRADFKKIRDIDTTLDEYLKYFKNTLAAGLPDETSADYRTVIKHIREMFKAKGAEKSVKFFFKALFDEEVDIFYPRTQMFVPSDSTWIRNRVVKTSISGLTPDDLKNKELTFHNGSLYVIDARISGSTMILNVSDIMGSIENISTLKLGTTELTIQKQVVGAKVLVPGTGFSVNDTYTLGNGVVVSVKEVTRGPVTGFNIISGGTGYSGTEEVVFTENGPDGKSRGANAKAKIKTIAGDSISELLLINGGSLYDRAPGVYVDSTFGSDATIRATGNFAGLKNFDILDGGYSLPGSVYTETIGDATIEVIFGNVSESTGTFADALGFVSTQNAYLQDEHYYQYFSYVIKVGINLDQYAKVFKQMIHPAGMKMFSSFTISTLLSSMAHLNSTEFFIKLKDFVSGCGAVSHDSLLNLYVSSYGRAIGLQVEDIDNFKFQWFNESTYINRFKDFAIRDLSGESALNLKYKDTTNIQPDLVVTLV